MPWWPLIVLVAVNPVAIQAAGVVASASVAAGVTFLLGRRNASGSVATSTATDLWTASDNLRRDLTDALTAERKARQEDAARFEREIARLEGVVASEVQQRHRVEDVNRELTERVAVLEAVNRDRP